MSVFVSVSSGRFSISSSKFQCRDFNDMFSVGQVVIKSSKSRVSGSSNESGELQE